jgi:hypothetical protein
MKPMKYLCKFFGRKIGQAGTMDSCDVHRVTVAAASPDLAREVLELHYSGIHCFEAIQDNRESGLATAAEILVAAYRDGLENGGSMDWQAITDAALIAETALHGGRYLAL